MTRTSSSSVQILGVGLGPGTLGFITSMTIKKKIPTKDESGMVV